MVDIFQTFNEKSQKKSSASTHCLFGRLEAILYSNKLLREMACFKLDENPTYNKRQMSYMFGTCKIN
jgi:hypothetical protein